MTLDIKSLAVAGAMILAAFGTPAQALTVTNVGGTIHQIDFKPVTFVAAAD